MATSKLYLIESQEREDLVKIGLAGTGEQAIEDTAVEIRIARGYLTGISDPSTVYEIPGTQIFEKYLHKFLDSYQKPVPITFKPSNRGRPGPREWFRLSPNTVAAIREAFSQESPTTIDQVSPDDLPSFFSGLFSAIKWEAKYTDPARMAEIVAQTRLLEVFEQYQKQVPSSDSTDTLRSVNAPGTPLCQYRVRHSKPRI